MVSDSTLQRTKKLPFVSLGSISKKNIHNYPWMELSFHFPMIYLCVAGFYSCTSGKMTYFQ